MLLFTPLDVYQSFRFAFVMDTAAVLLVDSHSSCARDKSDDWTPLGSGSAPTDANEEISRTDYGDSRPGTGNS
ncbi:MAG: hypothetical protein Ct9H300mP11_26040 [Chloroflexota bacterium]|nr:MAG: hypothetical protein Ct9H300mP11_26040 [Chloroflexota bacterium]